MPMTTRTTGAALAIVTIAVVTVVGAYQTARPQSTAEDVEVPVYQFDPTWPKLPLPNAWIMGNVAGMAEDENDHIWVIQRPLSGNMSDDYAQQDPPAGECCRMPPSIIEFDAAGKVVQAFGGPDPKNLKNKRTADGYEWPR